MLLSDISVKRPVLAIVGCALLIAFGILSFDRLPLREYPDIDPPILNVITLYPGASASVVENKITELIEDRLAHRLHLVGRCDQHKIITTDVTDEILLISVFILGTVKNFAGHFDQITSLGVTILIIECLKIIQVDIAKCKLLTVFHLVFEDLLNGHIPWQTS